MQADRAAAVCVIIVRRCLSGGGNRWLFPLAIVGVFALCAAHAPSDADWDLRNYHAYNAHALISGRFWTDIAPAQLQTFYVPFMDIAFGAIRDRLNESPILRNIVLSLPQGIAAALAFRLTLRVIPPALPARGLLALVATLFSAAGAAGFPTLASAMSDMVPGACILGGLLLLTGEALSARASAALAGVLLGIAAGLKLTTVPYCLAAGAALLVAQPRPGGSRLSALVSFGLAGMVTTALVGGPWWLLMYRHFGDPIFPYMNQFFRSPLVDPDSFTDTRFFPRGIEMAVAYPFYWATQLRALASELPVRDPRFAIAYVALAAIAVQALCRRPKVTGGNRTIAMLAVFFAVSFALWEVQFSVLRYLATLELLTGAMVLAALRPWLMRPGIRVPVACGFATLCIAAQMMTIYPDWGRMAAPLPMRARLPTAVESNAIVVLLDGAPMAYLADLLPAAVPLVGANNNLVQTGSGGLLAQRAATAIRNHIGPLYGMEDVTESPGVADRTLAYYHLRRGSCAPVESNLDDNAIQWCRLWPQATRDDGGPPLDGAIVSGDP
jgi:hypothetical protein